MANCIHCGSERIDARGICLNCGQTASGADPAVPDESPSLGETRAAEALANDAHPARPYAASPRATYTQDMPRYAPAAPVSGPRASGGTQAGGVRYCGTCGARTTGTEAFCGQCGTPLSASGGDYGMPVRSPTSFSPRNATSGWGSGVPDDATDMYAPPPLSAYPRQMTGVPYHPGTQYGISAPSQYANDSSRTIKVVFGIICLVGSIASAIGAVILAAHP